ncbi:MAG TPA: hypothetical protein VGO96_07980 [Pyrinomonadaceae bacterium]|jgi:hypothetical protein|nr:hypothetical protein [Pyrinomonadaceae bacterium]
MKSYRRFQILLIVVLSLTLPGGSGIGHAQQDWEKIPYQRWGKDEVKAVLEASPWSRLDERGTALAPMMFGKDTIKVSENLLVLLRSALPVRQALLRERQLESKYDTMSATDRAAFDAKNKALLECPACAKHYVISIKCPHLSCYTGTFIEDHKKFFYLVNDKGERRAMAGATPLPGKEGSAVFFFPRANDKGEPLLTPDSKEMTFHFMIQSNVGLREVSEKFKFDVTKMVRGVEVVF